MLSIGSGAGLAVVAAVVVPGLTIAGWLTVAGLLTISRLLAVAGWLTVAGLRSIIGLAITSLATVFGLRCRAVELRRASVAAVRRLLPISGASLLPMVT